MLELLPDAGRVLLRRDDGRGGRFQLKVLHLEASEDRRMRGVLFEQRDDPGARESETRLLGGIGGSRLIAEGQGPAHVELVSALFRSGGRGPTEPPVGRGCPRRLGRLGRVGAPFDGGLPIAAERGEEEQPEPKTRSQGAVSGTEWMIRSGFHTLFT